MKSWSGLIYHLFLSVPLSQDMSGKRRRGSSSDLGNAAPAIPPLPMARMRTPTSMSIFGYQEIFLRVMSFLSPTDLAMVQGVSRDWAKMSLDPQVSPTYLESIGC